MAYDPEMDEEVDGVEVDGVEGVLPPMPPGMRLPRRMDSYPLALPMEEVPAPDVPIPGPEHIEAAAQPPLPVPEFADYGQEPEPEPEQENF